MKKTAVLLILGFVCCMFSGCGGEEQTKTQRKPKVDPYADVEKCNIGTYKDRCGIDEDGQIARLFCAYSLDAGYAFVHYEACDEDCVVYGEQAQCVTECNPDKPETKTTCGTVMDDAVSIRQVVVQESCETVDGAPYRVKENIECDGICYNGQCLHVGDNCGNKPKERDSVMGCNGLDTYVCDASGKIHKKFCPDDGYCQSFKHDGDDVYFCASKCTSKKHKENVCSIIDNYQIETQCADIGNGALYKLHSNDLNITHSNERYCKNGIFYSLPGTVRCQGYCQEYCYNNLIAPWMTYGTSLEFFDCGIGRCDVKKHNASKGYAECMQPCDEEGEEITIDGPAYFNYSKAISSTLECKRFDDGLYYSTVYVEE